jgi:hypothetical protein
VDKPLQFAYKRWVEGYLFTLVFRKQKTLTEHNVAATKAFQHVVICSPPKSLFVITARLLAGLKHTMIRGPSTLVAMRLHIRDFRGCHDTGCYNNDGDGSSRHTKIVRDTASVKTAVSLRLGFTGHP